MGFLDNLRKSQNADLVQGWEILETEKQLAAAIELSHQKPVLLFKHSVSCGISASAKQRLVSAWDIDASEMAFYYLDLLAFRPVSNKIAELLDVVHQSPQVIMVKNGKAVFNTSHHKINVNVIKSALVS